MHSRTSSREADFSNDSKALSMHGQNITSSGQTGSSEESGPEQATDWRLVLLDCIAVLTEHLKLIVIATLFVGAVALAITLLLPKVYTSVAYVGPMEEANAKSAEVVLHSSPLLDSVLEKFPQYQAGYGLEERRNYLLARLSWTILRGSQIKSGIYALRFDDADPRGAQSILSAILDAWLETLGPRPDYGIRVGKLLEASEAQATDLSQVISELKKRPESMFADVRNGYFPPNIADMIKMRTETLAKITELQAALRAGTRDLIFSPPTLPQEPSAPRKKSIVPISMEVTFAGLIAFFLLRRLLTLAAGKPEYAPMFARMRRAMPW